MSLRRLSTLSPFTVLSIIYSTEKSELFRFYSNVLKSMIDLLLVKNVNKTYERRFLVWRMKIVQGQEFVVLLCLFPNWMDAVKIIGEM